MRRYAEKRPNASKKQNSLIGTNPQLMKNGMKISQTGLKLRQIGIKPLIKCEQHSLKRKNKKISSTVTEGEELPCTYKNYIYKGKNWKCPICSAEDHCGHYHCTQCQEIHPKDRSYKMRPSRQCKCLKISGSNSGEGEEAY